MTLSRILKWSDFLFCLAVKLRSNPSHLVFCSSKVSGTRRVLQMSLYPGTLSNFSSRGSEMFPRQKRNVISKGSSGSASFRLNVSWSPPDQKLLSTPSSSPYLPGWAHPPYGGNSSPSLESATSLFHSERRSTSKSRVSLRAQPSVDLRVQYNPHMFCVLVTRIQVVTKTINVHFQWECRK